MYRASGKNKQKQLQRKAEHTRAPEKKITERTEQPAISVQWYPGHMAKTRRMIQENLKMVDMVAEIVDARIPISSRNPDIDELIGEKPRLIILNRADQADPDSNRIWGEYFRSLGYEVLETDSKSGKGVNQFSQIARKLLKDKIEMWNAKGQVGRKIRAMVVGIPNVGKSTFINKVAGKKSAVAQNRPGVTRGKQWVAVDTSMELLDTPGILWPKFEDQSIGMNLAFTGAVRDDVMDRVELASGLMTMLAKRYPSALETRYKIEIPDGSAGWELLELAGKKRGFLISGGEVDLERMARILLEEYRSCMLGKFTLECPEDIKNG